MNEPLSHREAERSQRARSARGEGSDLRNVAAHPNPHLPLEAPLPEREGRNLSPDVRHARYRRNVALAIKLERLRLARRALADRKRALQFVLDRIAFGRGQRSSACGIGF